MRSTLAPAAMTLLLVAPFVAACSGASDAAACPNPTRTTTVQTKDFEFAPTCVEVDQGSTVTVKNEGNAQHNLTITDADLSVDVDPGDQATLALTGLSSGTYPFVCTFHPGMAGTLKVD